MSKNKVKVQKMEYGYIRQKKRSLLLQTLGIVGIGLAVFLLGLLLNKGELANIFTVAAVLFVIPAARYLTVLILIYPYHTPERAEYEAVAEAADGHGLLLSDLVFTSTERAMHLDYMVLAGGQAYCYVKRAEKQSEEKRKKHEKVIRGTEEYLNKHFFNQGLSMRAKVFEDMGQFLRAVVSHTMQEGELAEQEKVKESMEYFMV